MPANYKYYDALGLERTIPSVLTPVKLTSVATNATAGTKNHVTVNSTAELFPGMPFACPNIPPGSFIHAIKSDTVVELWASAWNATTGVFTTSAANAEATAAATGQIAYASGFCPRTIVHATYAMGTWRNLSSIYSAGFGPVDIVTMSASLTESAGALARQRFGSGMAVLPTAGTITNGNYIPTAYELIKSDDLQATPLKRHNGEPWGFYILVSTGGFQSLVQALPGREPLYAGLTA